jgi:uncharacterized DUF497 family protein
MRFEWDERKNRLNRQKHGISFETATEVFADPFSLTFVDESVEGESRLWTVGRLWNLVIVVVVHTAHDQHGDEVIRVISARKATARERRVYEEGDT